MFLNDRTSLIELINGRKVQLINAKYQIDFWERESKNPRKVGKDKAEEYLKIYESQRETLKTDIKLLIEYGKRMDLLSKDELQ